MKGKAVLSVLLMLMAAILMIGCGGGGGGSNPASSNLVGNATVSGVVYDLNNKPVNGASVRMVLASNALLDAMTKDKGLASARAAVAFRMSASVQTEFNGLTDAAGKYTFTGVPEGDYTLSAVTPNGAQIITNLSVRASSVPAPDMVLKPLGTVSGQVTLNGAGVAGSVVYAKGTSFAAITDASGNYTISGVPASTTITLCVQSSEGTANEQNVTITDLKTLSATAKTFVLTPVTASACKLDVTLTAANNNIDLNKCVVFAVCTDGTTYLASCKTTGSSNVCSFKITHAGSYSLFPAYYDNDIIALTSNPATDKADITDSNIKGAATLTKTFNLAATTSVFANLTARISSAASGDYKAVLISSNGNEHKKTVSAGNSFTFDNLAADTYILVVYNDTKLYVCDNISVADGDKKEISEITPVDVTPTITTGNGTVSFNAQNIKKAVNITESEIVKVEYMPLAHDKANDTFASLYKYDSGSKVKNFSATEANTETLNTDECSTGDYLPCIKVNVYRKVKSVFTANFENASASLGSNLWKTVALSGLSQSSNIVYFKTINFDGTINYLVVTHDTLNTLDTAYLFDAAGALKSSMRLPEQLTSNGNICFVESDGTNPKLLVALYFVPSPDANTPSGIKITGSEISQGNISAFNKSYSCRGVSPSDGEFTVYSPNKIQATYAPESSGSGQQILKVACACDRCFFSAELDPSDFTEKATPSKEALNTYTGSYYVKVVASCSSLVYVESGDYKYYDFYFLGCDEVAKTIIFGKQAMGYAPFYNTVARNICDMSAITTTLENLPTCGGYRLYALNNRSDFPFFLTTSFNGIRNQALINDSRSNNTLGLFDDYNYLYGDSKITTSGVKNNYNELYCIERSSNGQFLTGYDYSEEVIQRIEIKQIMNSNGYLEDSLGFVNISDIPQYHLLCADDSNNAQIMIINR